MTSGPETRMSPLEGFDRNRRRKDGLGWPNPLPVRTKPELSKAIGLSIAVGKPPFRPPLPRRMLRRSGKPARPEGRRLCSGLCRNLRKGDCAAATIRLAQISGCVYTTSLVDVDAAGLDPSQPPPTRRPLAPAPMVPIVRPVDAGRVAGALKIRPSAGGCLRIDRQRVAPAALARHAQGIIAAVLVQIADR
jgi:hypothetical protein